MGFLPFPRLFLAQRESRLSDSPKFPITLRRQRLRREWCEWQIGQLQSVPSNPLHQVGEIITGFLLRGAFTELAYLYATINRLSPRLIKYRASSANISMRDCIYECEIMWTACNVKCFSSRILCIMNTLSLSSSALSAKTLCYLDTLSILIWRCEIRSSSAQSFVEGCSLWKSQCSPSFPIYLCPQGRKILPVCV